jgi:hypothetical protein
MTPKESLNAIELIRRFAHDEGARRGLTPNPYTGPVKAPVERQIFFQTIGAFRLSPLLKDKKWERDMLFNWERIVDREYANPNSMSGAGYTQAKATREEFDLALQNLFRMLEETQVGLEQHPGKDWEFEPGRFSFKGKWCKLEGQKLNLLKAFVDSPSRHLSHTEINNVCAGYGEEDRHYNYVSDLNAALLKCLSLKLKPITPVRGEGYRLNDPPQ